MPATKNTRHPMRRSTRIETQIPLLVTSLDPQRRVCEECHTVAISAHGCDVRAHVRIPPGTRVLLDLLTEHRNAKGVVVDAVPLDNSGADWLIGIELETFGNFWRLSYAPPDWGTEAQHQVPATPQQQGEKEAAPAPDHVSACPVRLSDLSPDRDHCVVAAVRAKDGAASVKHSLFVDEPINDVEFIDGGLADLNI